MNKRKLFLYEVAYGMQVFAFYCFIFGSIIFEESNKITTIFLLICMIIGFLLIARKIIFAKFHICYHLITFCLLNIWILVRCIIDFGTPDHVVRLIASTTGGVLLFYLLGAFLRKPIKSNKPFLFAFYLYGTTYFVCSVLLNAYLLVNLQSDLLLANNAEGGYQRSGNLISVSFIFTAFIYVISSIEKLTKRPEKIQKISSFVLFLGCGILMALASQLIGSNSATIVVLISTFLACVFVFVCQKFRIHTKQASDFFKIHIFPRIIAEATVFLVFSIFFTAIIIIYFDLDIMRFRIFGFGQTENVSLSSRAEILSKWGWEQISYAPILGSLNVASIVTGDSGATLHNFFPDVWASLGLVGLLITLAFFVSSVTSLLFTKERSYLISDKPQGAVCTKNFYSVAVIIAVLAFANLSVGFTWPVIWFVAGLLGRSSD